MQFRTLYLRSVLDRFKSLKDLGDRAIIQLTDEEIHWTPNHESNSVATIVKHISGNMVSRWTDFLNSDGEKPYRNREQEFVDNIPSKKELISIWEEGWNTLFETLNSLHEYDLSKEIFIRGEAHFVVDAIERQLSHYSYHIGQIVFVGKQIKNSDWKCLSIPRGKSEEYTKELLNHNHKL